MTTLPTNFSAMNRMDVDCQTTLSILVVDDLSSERKLLSAILTRFGHHIVEVDNGKHALEEIGNHDNNFDLILLDTIMPDVDGYEVADRIRQLEHDKRIEWQPIIFLTSKNSPDDIAMGVERGGDDFISKPINSITLQAKIHAMSRVVKMRRDLIDTKRRLEIQVHKDELTGITNKRHFVADLSKEIARSLRHGIPMSLVMFNIDNFKSINDSRGEMVGDLVLTTICDVLSGELRHEDRLGRFEADTFCLCLPEQTADKAAVMAERLRGVIQQLSHKSDAGSFYVTASFGIAELARTDNTKTLIAKAYNKLVEAKDKGKNRVEAEDVLLPQRKYALV